MKSITSNVDLPAPESNISWRDKAILLGVPSKTIENENLLSVIHLHFTIAEEAKQLTSIKLQIDKPMVEYFTMLHLPKLTTLNLKITNGKNEDSRSHFWKSFDDGCHAISGVLSKVPISNLVLSHYYEGPKFFRIQSDTLQTISISHPSKLFWIEECVCPKLESFTCVESFYGSGIRPIIPRRENDENLVGNGDVAASTVLAKDCQCEGCLIPENCMIKFG